MKKVVRSVWISALSGLAFLVACCTQRGLTRAEKKKLVKERDSIENILASREEDQVGSLFYVESQQEYYQMLNRLDSINFRLGENVDLARNARRNELQFRLDSLRSELYRTAFSCVYGPPEVIEEYSRRKAVEMEQLENEIQTVRGELEQMGETIEPNIEDDLFPPVRIDPRKEAIPLYGAPDPKPKIR